MPYAADWMAHGEYSKLLPWRFRPYLAISVGHEYAKTSEDGIQNTESINRLTRLAKDKKPKMEITSTLKTNTDTSPTKDTSFEKEKSFCTM